jgi:hypothetical protein
MALQPKSGLDLLLWGFLIRHTVGLIWTSDVCRIILHNLITVTLNDRRVHILNKSTHYVIPSFYLSGSGIIIYVDYAVTFRIIYVAKSTDNKVIISI